MTTFSIAIATLFLGLLPFVGDGEFIPLLDGEILVGEISTHDEDGIEVKRLDTGGIVHLRWAQLAPPFERALRAKLGYTYDATEEVLVDADELTFPDGTRKVGRIVEQTPDRVVIKDHKSVLAYLRSTLAGAPARVRVPALDVYTKDELYNERLASVDVSTSQGNLDLARYLEQVQDFTRAIQHYGECKKLDPKFHDTEIAGALARVEDKRVRQEEYDYLREIDITRVQRRWDKAIALCDGFAAKFPKSAPTTRKDVDNRKKSFADLKLKEMVTKTYVEFYRAAERLAWSKAGDRKVSLAGAKSFADNEMKRLLVENASKAIQRDFKEVNEQEAVKLFGTRGKLPKIRSVSYGSGTFVLGAGPARAGLDLTGAGTAAPTASAEESEMAKKLKRLMEKTSGAAGGQGQQKKLDPSEEWWQLRAKVFERYQFLLAHFVESGSFFEKVGVRARHCIGCGGQGTITVTNSGVSNTGGVSTGGRSAPEQQGPAGTISATCPTCQGTGFERIVNYR